jgi:hypothetical protein
VNFTDHLLEVLRLVESPRESVNQVVLANTVSLNEVLTFDGFAISAFIKT